MNDEYTVTIESIQRQLRRSRAKLMTMNDEYKECGQDIGRVPEEVFEIRHKTIPEAADMMRIAGEKLAYMINEVIENIDAQKPGGMAKSRWAHELDSALMKWNEAHEVFIETMARQGK